LSYGRIGGRPCLWSAGRRLQGPCESERIPVFHDCVHPAGFQRPSRRRRAPHPMRVNARRKALSRQRLPLSVPSIIDRALGDAQGVAR